MRTRHRDAQLSSLSVGTRQSTRNGREDKSASCSECSADDSNTRRSKRVAYRVGSLEFPFVAGDIEAAELALVRMENVASRADRPRERSRVRFGKNEGDTTHVAFSDLQARQRSREQQSALGIDDSAGLSDLSLALHICSEIMSGLPAKTADR